jgi:uncharacterized metal-binding protein YceD (DUF177 family)
VEWNVKILVEGIPSAGLEVSLGLADKRPDWVTQAATAALDTAPTRLSGRIELEKASEKGVVVVKIDAEAARPAVCDRCAEPFELVVNVDSRLLYGPEERGTEAYDGTGELELGADDLELGWYRAGELDLEDVLREALALALPTRITCTDTEGCDRRTDALLAATRTADGPFAVLARLKRAPDAEK